MDSTATASSDSPWFVDGEEIIDFLPDGPAVYVDADGCPSATSSTTVVYALPLAENEDPSVLWTRLRVDATHIYWHAQAFYADDQDEILRIPLAGGTLEVVAALPRLVANATGDEESAKLLDFAVGDSEVYTHTPVGVFRIPKGGGEPELLVRQAADSRFSPRQSIAVDDARVYFTSEQGVQAASLVDGSVSVLLPGPEPLELAADEDSLYVSMSDDVATAQVLRIPKDGGEPQTLTNLPLTDLEPGSGAYLYGLVERNSDADAPGVFRILKAGGTPENVHNDCFFNTGYVEVDGDRLHYIRGGGFNITDAAGELIDFLRGVGGDALLGGRFSEDIVVRDGAVYEVGNAGLGVSRL